MFSLIVTIISIALVAALALATLYYGGSAFKSGAAKADAAKLLIQGQQILGATDLFKANHGRWPLDLDELVQSNYLKSRPVVLVHPPGPLGQATAAPAEKVWDMPVQGLPVFVLKEISSDVCAKVNLQSMQVDGVYDKLVTNAISQCYGPASKVFTMVVAREGAMLDEAVPGGFVRVGPLPATSDAGWVVRPLASTAVTPPVVVAPAPVLALSDAQLAFGAQPLHTPSFAQTVLTNTGNAALTFTAAPALSGSSAFALGSTTCGASLAAGASCAVTVSFTASAIAGAAGTLTLATNAGADQAVALSGSGLSALFSVSTSSVDFGAQPVGGTATPGQILLSNTGNQPLTFTAAPALTGSSAFTSTGTTCGATLAAGADCLVSVSFTPTVTDPVAGGMTFSTNAGANQTVALSGSGTQASVGYLDTAASVISSVAFPATPVGSNSAAQVVTLKNTGNVNLVLTGSVTAPAPFSITASTCTNVTLVPNDTCTATVVFSPAAAQSYAGLNYSLVYTSTARVPSLLQLTGSGNLVGVSSVASSDVSTVIVKTDGSLWMAGSVYTNNVSSNKRTFQRVPTMDGVVSVSAGSSTLFALKADGTLWAIGPNSYGNLGNGSYATLTAFTRVLTGVSSVSSGFWHTVALKSNGTVWATGYNDEGQLGDGTTVGRTGFAQATEISNVVSISAGYSTSYAIKSDGTLWAVGRNYHGQLGDGTTASRSTFGQVPGMEGVSSVSAGFGSAVALKTDGTLWATGNNDYGQIGDGTTTSQSRFKMVITGVSSFSAGRYHSTVIKADGTLWTAGSNLYGQLGSGTTTSRSNFVQVPSMGGSSLLSSGSNANSSMVIKADGTLWATGDNSNGQLGNGNANFTSTFAKVLP